MLPSRLYRFMEIVKQLQLPTTKGLILDVPTRWNSTYGMLESAMVFRDVFPRYKERDPTYTWLPTSEDWDKAMEVCKFLEAFNDATHIFSGVNYPTSNLFLPEVWKIKQILDEKFSTSKDYLQKMVFRMKEKFDKYWRNCNLLMAMGAVLDPRYKMKLIEFCYSKIYPISQAHEEIELVRFSLQELYNEYVANCSSSSMKLSDQSRASFFTESGSSDKMKSKTKVEQNLSCGHKNLILFLRICFRAGGRVLDQYRSSLKPETVQALICTGDWLRSE
ncbi:UNVERIFIED_CONTAM: Zinc finger BED domain-containing protein RICESLEEPER 2 [Sesamum latifolium]|uniref:Zinc finger BED domain-containing protein RICESLEEPER 2 n=1 Tax=Sesamum latifolium TaxID=2727402 RepID=A0AAW2YAA8_9LAMI